MNGREGIKVKMEIYLSIQAQRYRVGSDITAICNFCGSLSKLEPAVNVQVGQCTAFRRADRVRFSL